MLDQSLLDVASQTLSPLPESLFQGLIAVTFFGALSFAFSASLFCFLTYRLLSWRLRSSSRGIPVNQFLLLIYNLLLADIQQSIAFLLNFESLRNNALHVGTPTCFAQGWFISTGDLASSVWIFAIALHTFMAVVKDYKLPTVAFYCAIGGLWTFNYLLAVIGLALHPNDLYVRAGAWCWINDQYQSERLWLHYFWIFAVMSCTVCIYTSIFVTLKRRRTSSPDTPHGATPLMLLYPTIYTLCTIPVAAGRIASMAGRQVSLTYFCVAGCMIACNGWLDVLLYSFTRRRIVFSEALDTENHGIETFTIINRPDRMGTVTTVEGGLSSDRILEDGVSGFHGKGHGRMNSRRSSRRIRRADLTASSEDLYGANSVGIKTEVTVDVRSASNAYELENQHGMPKSQSGSGTEKGSWETKSGKSYDD